MIITDHMKNETTNGIANEAEEDEDDFFSSWDKPSIKQPTVSRTSSPPVIGRSISPYSNSPNNNEKTSLPSSISQKSTMLGTSRITSSASLRQTSSIRTGPKKSNILGPKKTKLGAKKITGEFIDFEAAEKKAKEEAERIARLGYDPDTEESPQEISEINVSKSINTSPLESISNGKAYNDARKHSVGQLERLGMGIGRLGFGQTGGNKSSGVSQKAGGFGSVGPIKPALKGLLIPFSLHPKFYC